MAQFEDSLKKGKALLSDLDQASLDRMEDARVLLAGGRSSAAIASAVYALEMRLKVLICKRLDLLELPQAFQFHDLEALLVLSGLKRRLEAPGAASVQKNWSDMLIRANRLNELRYFPDRNWPIAQAQDFLNWLEDPQDGVIPWLLNQP
jgi:hypothetical protein